LLENNLELLIWSNVCKNPNAVSLLEQNIDKIDWKALASNPNIFE
jgi:hypothetical protein